MLKILLFLFLLLITPLVYSQNVGIGTTTPAEKLDINGNVNVNGVLKASGTAGQPGEVLSMDDAGQMRWLNPLKFDHMAAFFNPTNANTVNHTASWTVPAGVTRIRVEIWGGGGGSNEAGGGGGGGYAFAYFSGLQAGDVFTLKVGAGGAGIAGEAQASGGDSSYVQRNGGVKIGAVGGSGAGTQGAGSGGLFIPSPAQTATLSFYGMGGHSGTNSKMAYLQPSASVFYTENQYGKGGDAGNTHNTGGLGGYSVILPTTVPLVARAGYNGSFPGGGAGSDVNGATGSKGLVIIYY